MLADDARLQIMLEELQQENENLSIQCNQLKATNAGLVADAARMLEGLQQENQNLLVQCGELTANAETSRKEFEECRTTIDAKQMHIEHLEIQLEDLQKQLREERKIQEDGIAVGITNGGKSRYILSRDKTPNLPCGTYFKVLIDSVVEAKVTEISDPRFSDQIKSVLAAEPIHSPLRTKFGIHANPDQHPDALVVLQNFTNFFSTALAEDATQEMIKQVKDLFVEFVSYGRIKEGNTYAPKTDAGISDRSLADIKQVMKALHVATFRTNENLSPFFAINAELEENNRIKLHLQNAAMLSDCLFHNFNHPTDRAINLLGNLEPGFDLLETQRQWTEEAARFAAEAADRYYLIHPLQDSLQEL